jgi:hypothetical protein
MVAAIILYLKHASQARQRRLLISAKGAILQREFLADQGSLVIRGCLASSDQGELVILGLEPLEFSKKIL